MLSIQKVIFLKSNRNFRPKTNKQQWHHWKGDAIRFCAMRNVDQTFCPKLLSTKRTFELLFSHFCYIKSQLSYLICSYMRRLAIQNSLNCTGTLQIFIHPHWYFILDTRLIFRTIKLFIYIQTCVNINVYAIRKQTLNYSSFIPLLQSNLRSDKQ